MMSKTLLLFGISMFLFSGCMEIEADYESNYPISEDQRMITPTECVITDEFCKDSNGIYSYNENGRLSYCQGTTLYNAHYICVNGFCEKYENKVKDCIYDERCGSITDSYGRNISKCI